MQAPDVRPRPAARRGLLARSARPRSVRALALLAAALALASCASGARAQLAYTLIDLTAGSPYDQTQANGINAAGHIAGYGVIASTGEIHAFIDRGGVFQDLGLLGYSASDGISINDSDQLAVDGIGPGSTALFYANGTARAIGSVDGGTTSAYGINRAGHIVGLARNGDGAAVGFSWTGDTLADLSPLGMYKAAAVNDADQIVGSSMYVWGYGGYLHTSSHACLVAGGVLTDLGSLTGDPRLNTEALGINAAGQVVGYSTASDNLEHAFLWSGGVMQDLGTLNGDNAVAVAINDSGLVVGNLVNAYNVDLGAFVWSNGTLSQLSDLAGASGADWSGLTVAAVNDEGWIVGSGTLNGGTHGFLAVPAQTLGVGTPRADLRTALAPARPNPFAAGTAITFTLSGRAAGAARLEIFDTAGRRVATLLDGAARPGSHTAVWSGRADGGAVVGGGVYFARLTTPDGALSRKLVLLR